MAVRTSTSQHDQFAEKFLRLIALKELIPHREAAVESAL